MRRIKSVLVVSAAIVGLTAAGTVASAVEIPSRTAAGPTAASSAFEWRIIGNFPSQGDCETAGLVWPTHVCIQMGNDWQLWVQ